MNIEIVFDPAESVEVIKGNLAKLQHLCGQASLTKDEAEYVQEMAVAINRSSVKILMWAEKFSKDMR